MNTLFSGRLDRRAYALSSLALYGALFSVIFLIALTLGIFADYAGLESGILDMVALLLPFVPFYFYRFSLDARRLHDIGYSGYFSILRLIPFFGIVVPIYLLSRKGRSGSNKYGDISEPFSISNIFFRKKVVSNDNVTLIIVSVIMCTFLIETILPILPIPESEWANNPAKKARDAKQEEVLGEWLLTTIIGWTPIPEVSKEITPISYECENGKKFSLEIIDDNSVKMISEDGASVTLPKEGTGADKITVFGDDKNALTFTAGYDTQVIKTERTGPFSTICNPVSDERNSEQWNSAMQEKIMKVVDDADAEKDYQVKTLDNEYFVSQKSVTDGGQVLDGYFKDGQLRKLTYSVGLSSGRIDYLYYFDDGKLVFVFEQEKLFPANESGDGLDYGNLEPGHAAAYFFQDGHLLNTKTRGERKLTDNDNTGKHLLANAKEYVEVLLKMK